MISSLNSSISALKAFGTKIKVSANNISNILSEGYKKKRVILTEGPQHSVIANIETVNTPGVVVPEKNESGTLIMKELSNVALEEEIPQSMISKRYFEASLNMIESEDELLGEIVDIIS